MGNELRAAGHTGGARPRYHRMWAAGVSAVVTLVAVLGATGVIPTSTGPEPAAAVATQRPQLLRHIAPAVTLHSRVSRALPRHGLDRGPSETALPSRSGEGRRIVFDMGAQRVWLVRDGNRVARTYLVSGSLTDNLGPGTYEVYSKSVDAIGIDDSGTMKYMVRFAHGDRAAIGFHDIPIADGKRVQTFEELGTPQSHGCIRQKRVDAKALWRFAPIGTEVVVLA